MFWGSASMVFAIVLAVIAAKLKDLRFLLIVAWPFGCVAAWQFLQELPQKRLKVIITAVTSLGIGLCLLWLNTALAPTSTKLTRDQEKEFTNVLKSTIVSSPTYTIIACPDADEPTCVYAAGFIPLFQRAGWKVEGPAVERVRLGRPTATVSIVQHGPPLVDPQNPDQGVWTTLSPWDQLLKTAFNMVGIQVERINDPNLPNDKIRIYFGSVPTN